MSRPINSYLDNKVSLFQPIFSKKQNKVVPGYYPHSNQSILNILKWVRDSPKLKEITDRIRNEPDKEKRTKIKINELSAVTFAGEFEYRKKDNILTSSNIALVDIDEYDFEKSNQLKEKLKQYKFVAFTFISPSGGLKFGIRIPEVKNDLEYKQYYLAIIKHFKDFNIESDESTKDISRLCFLSYDPDIYINLNPEIFTQKEEISETSNNHIGSVDRSQHDWNLLLGFLRSQKNPRKDKAFEYMEKWGSSKWKDSTQEYKDHTFHKVYDIIINHKDKDEKIEPLKKSEIKSIDNEHLSEHIIGLLLRKDTKNASEILTQSFKEKNNVFSLRTDDKPEMYIYKEGIYIPNGKTYVEEFCREIIKHEFSTYFVNQIISKIQTDSYIEPEQFFNFEPIDEIPVQNGILNLKSLQLSDFTPKKFFFNKLPMEFNTEAKGVKAKNFVKDIVEDEEDVKIIQELIGYSLYKDYSIEKSTMLIGHGANGKSKLLELIKHFVGPVNCSDLSLSQLSTKNRFDIISLHKSLINLAGDIDGDEEISESGLFKKLSGGKDLIRGEEKFKMSISFVNYAKLVFSSNDLPNFKDKSDGLWRRWQLINFPYRFEHKQNWDRFSVLQKKGLLKERNNDVLDEIVNDPYEMSSLLNWAIEGLHRLFKNKKFTDNKFSKDIKKYWERRANPFSAFVEENLELGSMEDYVSNPQMRREFLNYVNEHSIRKIITTTQIREYLKDTMGLENKVVNIDGSTSRCWIGIRWKNENKNSDFSQKSKSLNNNIIFEGLTN